MLGLAVGIIMGGAVTKFVTNYSEPIAQYYLDSLPARQAT